MCCQSDSRRISNGQSKWLALEQNNINRIIETKQGFKYSGELKDGEMTGYGKVTMPNGESKTGYWEKGVLVN